MTPPSCILERAKVYCPKDTEALVRSGRVVIELRELRRASAQIRFGDGASEAYAVIQHERLDYRHDPPEQAKYLQRAVDELSPQMTVLIGRGAVTAAKRRLRSNVLVSCSIAQDADSRCEVRLC